MSKLMHLRVVTPQEVLLDEEVRSVQFMGIDGSYGILPGHAPLMTATFPSTSMKRGLTIRRLGGVVHSEKERSVYVRTAPLLPSETTSGEVAPCTFV